jgi:hypothetical protein
MRIRSFAMLLGTLGLVACNDTDPAFAPSAFSGPYVLQSINDVAIPAVVIDSANPALRLDALSGTITIKADNTFTDVTTLRQTLAGVVSTRTVNCGGTYTAVGNVFQFVESGPPPGCGFTFTGVVSGATLTASVLGVPATFGQ